MIVSQNILPATNYECRLQYKPASERPVEWSAWLDVLTPSVFISQDELDDELDSRIKQVEEQIPRLLKRIRDDVNRVATAANSHFASVRELAGQTQAMVGARFTQNADAIVNAEASVTIVAQAVADLDDAFAAYGIFVDATYATITNTVNAIATAKSEAIFTAGTNADGAIAAFALTVSATYETITNSTNNIATAKSEAVGIAATNTNSAIAAYTVTVNATFETITGSTNKISTAKSEAISASGAYADQAISAYNVTVTATFETKTNVDSKITTAKTETLSLASANTDTAIATFRQTIFVESGGQSAFGHMHFTVASTPSGASASYALAVSFGGSANESGMYFDAMPGFSRFRFVADRFVFDVPGNTGIQPFIITTIDGNPAVLMDNAYINKLVVGTAAVKMMEPYGSISIVSNNQQLASLSLTTVGNSVQVTWETDQLQFLGGSPGGGEIAFIQILIDGSVHRSYAHQLIVRTSIDGASGQRSRFLQGVSYTFEAALSAGAHTFTVRANWDGSSGLGGSTNNSSLKVEELRRIG